MKYNDDLSSYSQILVLTRMLGVGGDNFSTGQGGWGKVGGWGKAPGSRSKLTLTLPRPLKPVPCWLDFFSSEGESNE